MVMKVLLQEWQNSTLSAVEDLQVIRVHHRNIWKDTLQAISKDTFRKDAPLLIHFIGKEAAELYVAIDGNEIFLLTISRAWSFPDFFQMDPIKMQNQDYYFAGLITAMSLLHDGPSIQFLSPTMARCVCDIEEHQLQPSISEIPSPQIQSLLEIRFLLLHPE